MLPFKWIERAYGLLGLFMIVFAAALVADPSAVAARSPAVSCRRSPSGLSTKELLTFGYFAVAIISAVMFPYEVYFYSSGGIEEEWGPKDLLTNRMTSIVGMGLGSLLAISILANSAHIVRARPMSIPEIPGSAALEAAIPFGKIGA